MLCLGEYVRKVQDYKSKWQVAEGEKSRLEAKVQRDELTVKRLRQQVEDMVRNAQHNARHNSHSILPRKN
jgi:hypothetical protein